MSDRAPADAPWAGRRALVAAADTVSQHLARRLLEAHGLEVLLARAADEALDVAARERVDLVLVDAQLLPPDGGGHARAGGAASVAAPVVVLARDDAAAADVARWEAAGARYRLAKPLRREALAELLDALYRDGSGAADAPAAQRAGRDAGRDAGGDAGHEPEPDDAARVAAMLRLADGDVELVRILGHEYLRQVPRLLAELRAAVDDADADRLRRAAHTLKGSTAQFGAADVARMALALEHAGAEGRLDGAAAALDPLERALDGLRRVVERVVAGELPAPTAGGQSSGAPERRE
jgi:two-component system, sensor histidine kinase and response regulator